MRNVRFIRNIHQAVKEDYKMDLKKEEELLLKKVCPFVKNPPSKDCHVMKTSSLSMMAAMKYCGRYFKECEIYRGHCLKLQKIKKGGIATNAAGDIENER